MGGRMEIENPDMTNWSNMAHKLDGFTEHVKIALIGKYTGLQDSYLSVIKSLKVSGSDFHAFGSFFYNCSTHIDLSMIIIVSLFFFFLFLYLKLLFISFERI